MSFLEIYNAEIISEQNVILEEVTPFYENIYSHRETADVDLDSELQRLKTLTEEDKELIEGRITYAEALASLRKMKHNKSPGCDGFSVALKQIGGYWPFFGAFN